MAARKFTDQLGRSVSIPFPPKRIISLVPSQTELLFDLGLEQEIVGITKFCIHPADKFKSKQKVGGTKKLNIEKIRSLKPDLIIGNKEENEQSQIESLMKEFNVWMSDIHVLDEALKMIDQLGEITGKYDKAKQITTSIRSGFDKIHLVNSGSLRVAYFIWKDPYMLAGRNTFIHDMIERAGWQNAADAERYPVVSKEEISAFQPDVILLSSEPYPFKDVHVKEMEEICPDAKVIIVDGEMFSWYGSRLRQTPAYLGSLASGLK